VIVIGLSHQTAPIEVRERLAIAPDRLVEMLARIHALEPVSETVVLSTCNRVEIYASAVETRDDEEVLSELTRMLADAGGREVVPHLVSATGDDAVKHVFRVASSLDSLVVGEPQILGQLKTALMAAAEANTLRQGELSATFKGALRAAKRVRSETAVGAGQVSVPSVAVDLARQIFEQLSGHPTLLVGAGEMAESAAKLIARAGAPILVANRSPERAEQLATSVGGQQRPWNELEACLIEADIVVSSTASREPIISYEMLKGIRRKRRGRSLFLIDIAVPRDVDPRVNELDNVYLYDIDDLSHVVARSLEGRVSEAEKAEALVAEEVSRFTQRRAQQVMKPLIVALRERTRGVLMGELDKSCNSKLKHLGDDEREALAKMMDAAVNKLMHQPTQRLKKLSTTPQSGDVAEILAFLFDLDESAIESVPRSNPPGPKTDQDQQGGDEGGELEDDNAVSGERVAVR
jgi:glutamyl-tRNA reductase